MVRRHPPSFFALRFSFLPRPVEENAEATNRRVFVAPETGDRIAEVCHAHGGASRAAGAARGAA